MYKSVSETAKMQRFDTSEKEGKGIKYSTTQHNDRNIQDVPF
ncbi:MAG: hypothetical protein ACI90V_005442 [Bacillariaceae sp.]|jgi:hypothetical protein